MKTFIITLLVSLLIISSCRKNQQHIPARQGSSPGLFSAAAFRAGSENPFDSTGIWHNIFLDSVRAYVRSGGENTRQGRLNYLISLGRKHFSLDVSQSAPAIQQEVITASMEGYETIIRKAGYGRRAENYFLQLLRYLKTTGYERPGRTENYLDILEKEVTADRSVHPSDKKSLLQVSSVARYSFRYWSQFSITRGRFFGFIPEHWSPLAHVAALVGDVVAAVKGAAGGGKDVKQVALESAATSEEVGNKVGDFLCFGDC